MSRGIDCAAPLTAAAGNGNPRPALNLRYYNGEVDDDLPYVGMLDLDPETGCIYDEEGDVVDEATLAAMCEGDGKGDDALRLMSVAPVSVDMSNSELVTFTRLSPNNSGRRTHAIDRITPHCVVGQCSVEALGALFAAPARGASSNYGVGADGRVGMYVEESCRSWCTSSGANDNRAVTIEVASDSYAPYAFREAAYAGLVELCADICRRNGKTKLLWFGDKDKTFAYDPAADEMVLTVHRWFALKSCPGDWLYARMGQLADAVTKNLQNEEDEDMTKERFKELWNEVRADLQDNDASEYSDAAREWAKDTGLVKGGDGDDFNGMWEDVLTREQMVTMLYRFALKIGAVSESTKEVHTNEL